MRSNGNVLTLAGTALVALALGCSSGDSGATSKAMEERMKDIEARMKASMPKIQQIALEQKADPAVVKRAQQELGVLKEYLDEPTGKIDSITVNAIEAFQRRVGLRDDGLLDEETIERLDDAAKTAQPGRTG